MDSSDKIVVKKESLEKLKVKLKMLKVSVEDKNAKALVVEALEFLDNEIMIKDISLEEMIREKMIETKVSNPDQHFKFYMLYRKLQDNKITQEEALRDFEIYKRL